MIVEKRTHYSRNSEREVGIDYILKNASARRTDGVVKPDLHDATEGKRVHLFAVSQIYPTGYECETNYSWKIIMSWNILFICVWERERESEKLTAMILMQPRFFSFPIIILIHRSWKISCNVRISFEYRYVYY